MLSHPSSKLTLVVRLRRQLVIKPAERVKNFPPKARRVEEKKKSGS